MKYVYVIKIILHIFWHKTAFSAHVQPFAINSWFFDTSVTNWNATWKKQQD